LLALAAAAVVGLVRVVRHGPGGNRAVGPAASPPVDLAEPGGDAQVFSAYAGSASCRGCHREAYDRWTGSHHARAERGVDPGVDRGFFDPARTFTHASQTSATRARGPRLELRTASPGGPAEWFVCERVIGVDPLRQFLVPAAGGRWQATELAVDPRRGDWFNVYGVEDRQPGEWGHWTGRGMNWNQMCAVCHNTRLRKNYQAGADAYATTMAEAGVGCEACHGPMAAHVAWQQPRAQPAPGDPTIRRFDKPLMLSACAPCHARRSELTGEFEPGEHFLDHHSLAIPDASDLYHADGQVRDEDYEYTSFLSSRMGNAGVWCMDCHDPHAGRPRTPDNSLCQRCHGPPIAPAPKINAATHSHHRAGEPGDRCVDCHMPLTVYMARHPRRDHGFTVPDPLLTRQHGIPNACNRCHADQTTAWALQATEQWYGKRMARPTRHRAQIIARARQGELAVLPQLVRLAGEESLPLWRATAASLLEGWATVPAAGRALLTLTRDHDALVRARAARALEPLAGLGDAPAGLALTNLLQDPVRSVRTEAAWSLRRALDTNSVAGRDLVRELRFNLDQPLGVMRLGVFLMDRGQVADALPWMERAVAWDPGSAILRDSLAVCLSTLGRASEAVRQLGEACRLAPRDPAFRFRLGLALNEAGQLSEAVAAFEAAVQLDPAFGRAWYNLGLAQAAAERLEDASLALGRAESLASADPVIPYARATVLARLGRTEEARAAAQRALELRRNFPEAADLLRSLSPRR
jgi:tetratricopeptide (TPR) repeat protein